MLSNAAALTSLMFAEERALKRLFARLVERESLEDILQSLWIRVQRVEDDPPIEDKNAFLFYLAKNVALDEGRREARRKRLQTEVQEIISCGVGVVAIDDEVIARDELARVLQRAQALPEFTRTIFYLNRMDHVPLRDIAKRLGVSRTTVEKHMRRALAALAKALDES